MYCGTTRMTPTRFPLATSTAALPKVRPWVSGCQGAYISGRRVLVASRGYRRKEWAKMAVAFTGGGGGMCGGVQGG